jgi:hypothetical protein
VAGGKRSSRRKRRVILLGEGKFGVEVSSEDNLEQLVASAKKYKRAFIILPLAQAEELVERLKK